VGVQNQSAAGSEGTFSRAADLRKNGQQQLCGSGCLGGDAGWEDIHQVSLLWECRHHAIFFLKLVKNARGSCFGTFLEPFWNPDEVIVFR